MFSRVEKMKINANFPELEKLIQKMGASKTQWTTGLKSKQLDLSKLFTIEGLDVEFEELTFDENDFIFKKGQQVLLFIKDQWITAEEVRRDPLGGKSYKFHIVGHCKTLEQMRNNGRFDRYTVTANQNGKFSIFARESKHSSKKIKLVTKLSVCLNCLIKLNYKGSGYSRNGINSEARLAKKNFNIKEFFTEYSESLINRPKYDDFSYPDPNYNPDFRTTSRKLKEAWKYKCSRCNVSLNQMNHRKLLHCHHRDGNPGNNSEVNLEILCIACHAEEGFHLIRPKHMRKQYEECLKIKKDQNIKI